MLLLYTYISMFSTVSYYNKFKKFIFQHLFGWVSCINVDSNSINKQGSYIRLSNTNIIYDPEFSFLSPTEFPPKLPNNSRY
jgi:hypothetical protein